MAKLLSGKEVAAALREASAAQSAALSARGVVPTLAIVRVGERPDDVAYEAGAAKRCENLGVAVRSFRFPETVSQAALLACLDEINGDAGIHGCLLLRPLPKHLDGALLGDSLLSEKDVDGITDGSLAGVFTGAGRGYPPCTAQACMEILDYYNIDVSGKRVAVVGRSLVVGRPVAMLLLARNATVTICHTGTVDRVKPARQCSSRRWYGEIVSP